MKNFKIFDHILVLPFVISLLFLFFINGIAGKDKKLIDKSGGYTITAYCPESCCNGPWAYKTSNGKNMGYYIARGIHIAATDPEVIPHGTRFYFKGKEYLAMDVGGAIKGRRIDLLMYSHGETERFGIKHNQKIKLLR